MIITIGRKFGSGGLEIGQKLAKRLDIPCYSADRLPGGSGDERFAVMREMANSGSCVIVGFCADHVLDGHPELIRVFIHSPMEYRVSRLCREYGLSAEKAERQALSEDRERARLYGAHTKKIWADLSHYDITVDSSLLGINGTVELLRQLVAFKVMSRRSGKEAGI